MRSESTDLTATGQVTLAEAFITGAAFSGFTSVTLYDGTDTSGRILFICTVPGAYYMNHEIHAKHGVYAVLAGSGTLVVNTC